MNKRQWLIVGVVGVAIILAVPLLSRFSRSIARKRYNQTEEKFKSRLSAGTFLPIQDRSVLESAIRQAVEIATDKTKTPLSSSQRESLVARVSSMFAAYNDGKFESFAHFRYPKNLNRPGIFEPAYLKSVKEGIVHLAETTTNLTLLTPLGNPPDFPKANTAALLETSYNLFLVAGAQWTNPVFCATCWQETAPDKIEIQLNIFTNKIGTVRDILKTKENLGSLHAPLNYTVHPTPKDILKRKKALLTAYVSVVIKSNEPPEVTPIFVQFYWVDEFSDWIPFEFVNGYGMSKLYHVMDL